MDRKVWKPRRVLIGYDGSDGANDAVALARTLCGDTDARYLLVHVVPFPGPPPVAGEILGYQEAAEWKVFFVDAEKTLGRERTEHAVYVGGSVGKVLNDIAETEGIDLAVVGSPHRGAIGRIVLGSVAEGLLHGASVPIVAAPRGYRERVHDGFARIVVGHDGSREADAALATGAALAKQDDLELHVVAVGTPPVAAPGPFAGPIPPTLPDALGVVVRAVRSVEGDDDDIDVRGEALHGSIVPELTAFCGPDDLLLVGSRSYGPIARTLLGSISSVLIHAVPCPVLVVPRPEQPAEESDPAAEPAVAETA